MMRCGTRRSGVEYKARRNEMMLVEVSMRSQGEEQGDAVLDEGSPRNIEVRYPTNCRRVRGEKRLDGCSWKYRDGAYRGVVKHQA